MTEQERNQILKMIENGKITPQEGLHLMQTLEQSPAEDAVKSLAAGGKVEPHDPAENPSGTAQAESSNFDTNPRIARIKSTARRLWQIPLWIGIGILLLSAYGMYALLQGAGMNFWFYFLTLPLLLGVVIIVAAVGTRQARWIFVDVRQKPGDHPERIFLGFPLPLRLAAGFLRTFGHYIPELKKTNLDEVIQAVEVGFSGNEPLVVNVDEGEEGERVQVYIG